MITTTHLNRLTDQFIKSLQQFLSRYEPIDELLLQRSWLEDNDAPPELLAKFDNDFGEDIKAVLQAVPFKGYEYFYWLIRTVHVPFTHIFIILFLTNVFIGANSILVEELNHQPTNEQLFIFIFKTLTIFLGIYYTVLDFKTLDISVKHVLSKTTSLSLLYMIVMGYIYQTTPTFPTLDGTGNEQSLLITIGSTITFIYILTAMLIFTRWMLHKLGLY